MRSTQAMELERSNPSLTEQECRLLILACRGLSNREIAEQVALAESTVKKLLYRAVRKLDFVTEGIIKDYVKGERGNYHDYQIMIKQLHREWSDF